MVEVVDLDVFRQYIGDAYLAGVRMRNQCIAGMRGGATDSVLREHDIEGQPFKLFVDQLAQSVILYTEAIPRPKEYRFEGDRVEFEQTDWKSVLPRAADSYLLVMRRQIKMSTIVFGALGIATACFAVDINGLLECIGNQCEGLGVELLSLAGKLIGGILALADRICQKERLGEREHCLFIKAWQHAEAFTLDEAANWFPFAHLVPDQNEGSDKAVSDARKCNIPKKRYWRCKFRSKGSMCELDKTPNGAMETLRGIVEGLVEKGYLKAIEEPSSISRYIACHLKEGE